MLRAEDMDEDDLRPRRRRRVDEAQAGDLDDENDADVRAAAACLHAPPCFAQHASCCRHYHGSELAGSGRP